MFRKRFPVLCSTSASQLASKKKYLEDRITALGDDIVRPVDSYGLFTKSTYTTPMVILLGNHSSGKSTFINSLLGIREQETGLAPTDDGFTVIQRGSTNIDEHGPTALSNPSNGFTELQHFGNNLQNHFKLKVRKLPESAKLPEGMMIVDTPGMIDTPRDAQGKSGTDAHSLEAQARGYDFLGVTKWFAQRADTILLMFDPNNPGTTGETLMVLTNSLVGHEHKFKIVLNKSDMFRKTTDYARAYGTLAWNLSKVIQVSKDIPPIYSAYTKTEANSGGKYQGAVPEEEMARARKELTKVVLSAPLYRLDNLMTEMEESARRVFLAATVTRKVQSMNNKKKWFNNGMIAASIVVFPTVFASVLVPIGGMMGVPLAVIFGVAGIGGSGFYFNKETIDYERKLIYNLDLAYEECFPGEATVEEKQRWSVVKKVIQEKASKQGISGLPSVGSYQADKVTQMLSYDVPSLRKTIREYKEAAARQQEDSLNMEVGDGTQNTDEPVKE